MVTMRNTLQPGHLRNTCQYTAKSKRGNYLVQVAWPLSWNQDRIPAEVDDSVSLVYLVDGNEHFFTAVDIARRLDLTNNSCKTIVVGVGYSPPCSYAYGSLHRGPDLTAPSDDGRYKPFLNSEGEANQFLDFIREDVMAFVEGELFSHLSLAGHHARRAVYGHSHGGLFLLSSLYTNSTLFDTIIAEQPPQASRGRALSLILVWGSSEDDFSTKEKSQDSSCKGNCDLDEEEMGDSMTCLIDHLKGSRHCRTPGHGNSPQRTMAVWPSPAFSMVCFSFSWGKTE